MTDMPPNPRIEEYQRRQVERDIRNADHLSYLNRERLVNELNTLEFFMDLFGFHREIAGIIEHPIQNNRQFLHIALIEFLHGEDSSTSIMRQLSNAHLRRTYVIELQRRRDEENERNAQLIDKILGYIEVVFGDS